MPVISPAFKGPIILIGVGAAFALLGTLPLVITLALGIKTIATVIGVGFIGFGMMLIIPGVCWCLIAQRQSYLRWRARRRTQEDVHPALGHLTSNNEGHEEEGEGSDHEKDSSSLQSTVGERQR